VRIAATVGLVAASALAVWMLREYMRQEQVQFAVGLLLDRGIGFAWLAFIMAAATAGGLGVLGRVGCLPAGVAARMVFGAATGLGAAVLAVLVLGVCGLAHTWLLAALLLAFGLSGLSESRRWVRAAADSARSVRPGLTAGKAVWAVLLVFFAINLTRGFEPPWEYDALEYHLGAPAQWHRANRITFLRDNVYSNMPFHVEMLYFLSMRLRGTPEDGAALGKLLNCCMAFLTALGLRAALARLCRPLAGDAAAAIYYTWPGVTLYSGMEYVEIAQQFYGVLALWALAMACVREPEQPGRRRWLALCGVMTGFALGVKYPSAVFVLAPALAATVILGLVRRLPVRETCFDAALVTVLALALWSPWLIRNAVNTGNPVYPLLYSVFGGKDWTPLQEARWQSRHSPADTRLPQLPAKVWAFLSAPEDGIGSEMLFLFAPFAVLAGRRCAGLALSTAGYAAYAVLAWFYLTHQADRFLAPVVPMLAALGGMGLAGLPDRLRRPGVAALLVLAVAGPSRLVNYALFERSLGSFLGESPALFFQSKAPQFRYGFEAMQFLNDERNVPADARVLFFPEARTFWCRRHVIANTPFDRSLLEEAAAAAQTPDDLAQALRRAGVTHVLVNLAEVDRLLATGDFEYQGRVHRHALGNFNRRLFEQFAEKHLEVLKTFGPRPDRPMLLVYRLRPAG